MHLLVGRLPTRLLELLCLRPQKVASTRGICHLCALSPEPRTKGLKTEKYMHALASQMGQLSGTPTVSQETILQDSHVNPLPVPHCWIFLDTPPPACLPTISCPLSHIACGFSPGILPNTHESHLNDSYWKEAAPISIISIIIKDD